ncbi:MAG: ABC transporter ATP-binding protein [Eubacteriales bacterium]|nr:ABC transporter ATP-binding protein [Eubacteriales bacterium]
MVRKLAAYFKGYGIWVVIAPTLILIEVALRVYIPRFTGQMMNEGILLKNSSVVYHYGIKMIIFALISLAIGAIASFAASTAGQGFGANLREATFENIQRFDFQNIDHFSAPSLITRLTNDCNRLSRMAQMSLRLAVRAPFMFITSFIMALNINRELSLVFVVAIPLISLVVIVIARRAMNNFRKMQEQLDQVNGAVQENLNGIRIVKSFTREEHEIDKFDIENIRLKDLSLAAMYEIIKLPTAIIAIISASIMAVLYIGTKGVVDGSILPGDLFSFLMYIGMVLNSITMIFMVIMNYARAKASAERVLEVLEEKPVLAEKEQPLKELRDGSIELRNLSFRYHENQRPILENISLRVEAGETLAIIGATGSGKTSLIQLFARLYDRSDGELLVGGQPVEDYKLSDLREQVAVVLQKNTLFRGSLRENLQWGKADATDEEILEVLRIAQAENFVMEREGGLDATVEQGGANFSGGQKQRLSIARSLLKQPKIIIFDDSTSALDMATERKLRSALDEALPDLTKVIIAQRISSVADADKILLLEKGQMNGFGTHEELLANNVIYQEIVASQEKGVLAS